MQFYKVEENIEFIRSAASCDSFTFHLVRTHGGGVFLEVVLLQVLLFFYIYSARVEIDHVGDKAAFKNTMSLPWHANESKSGTSHLASEQPVFLHLFRCELPLPLLRDHGAVCSLQRLPLFAYRALGAPAVIGPSLLSQVTMATVFAVVGTIAAGRRTSPRAHVLFVHYLPFISIPL